VSIRRQLLVTYLGITMLGIMALGIHSLWTFQTYFRELSQADLEARTTALRQGIAEALARNDLKRVDLLVQRHGSQEGIQVRVIAPDGSLVSTSVPDSDRQLGNWRHVPGVGEALTGGRASGVARGVFARGDRLYEAQPILHRGRLLGVLRMSITLEHFQRQLRHNFTAILATGLLTFGLCALVSLGLARGMARPIQAMRDFAVRVGKGSFGEKLDVRRQDELGELATELVRMSQQLASIDSERKSFLASVSHELRTPVTNVRVTLEALASGADAEPELRARFLQSAQNEMGRLSKLIQDLLDLGRLEASEQVLQRQEIRLRDLLDRTLEALEPRLQAGDVRIDCRVPDFRLTADGERLAQVFMNLLDNAVKYSPPDSTVTVSAHADGDSVFVRVQDQGPGIKAEDLPRVFDRFFMSDPSRTGSGTGLGLTIARRIVEAHGGTIAASSGPGRGSTFTVQLPVET
jgi:signal transduction histidine kinase